MSATATTAPARPQYMYALERANEVILYCPWEAHGMALAELLTSQHRWGQARCRKVLAQLAISEGKTVGSMTARQRHALAAMLTSDEREHVPSATA
jgi:hypothetical protein